MKEVLCTSCGYQGKGKQMTRGLFAVELLLWLCFLLPGLAYSIWRLSTRYFACPQCGSANVIPPDSPVAKQFLAKLNKDSVPPEQKTPPQQTKTENLEEKKYRTVREQGDYDDEPNVYVIK